MEILCVVINKAVVEFFLRESRCVSRVNIALNITLLLTNFYVDRYR
jgi:hypothetical protein